MEDEPLYVEYHKIRQKFKEYSKNYDKILEQKAMLYFNTQPKATNLDKELVNGGITLDKFEQYVEKLEKIDMDLQKARNERDLQQYFLKRKEIELKASRDIMDRLYVLKYIDLLKTRYIAIRLNYGKSQIYDNLNRISNLLSKIETSEKIGKKVC